MNARVTGHAFVALLLGASLACGSPPRDGRPAADPPLEIPRLGDAGSASERAVDGVRFGRVPTTVGARWALSVRAESRLEAAPGTEQRSAYESDVAVEVLAVDHGTPSRVRLAFERNVQVHQGAEKPTSVDGRTYVIDQEEPHVRDERGSAAPEEEATRVLDVFPELGMRARIDQALPERPMRIGDRHDALAAAVLSVLHPRAWTLRRGTAELARVEGDVAVFAVALEAVSASAMHMDVSGEVRIGLADARLASIALDGTYEGPDGARGDLTLRRTERTR